MCVLLKYHRRRIVIMSINYNNLKNWKCVERRDAINPNHWKPKNLSAVITIPIHKITKYVFEFIIWNLLENVKPYVAKSFVSIISKHGTYTLCKFSIYIYSPLALFFFPPQQYVLYLFEWWVYFYVCTNKYIFTVHEYLGWSRFYTAVTFSHIYSISLFT